MTLTQGNPPSDYQSLGDIDPILGRIAGIHGWPDPYAWDDGGLTEGNNFAALLLHITGQQISTAVAFVLVERLRTVLGGLPTPAGILSLGPDRLRALGMSRAKAAAMMSLGQMQVAGELDVDDLDHLDDEQAVAVLTRVRGVGRWTAEMFLVHQLRRADVLPAGDLGIRRAVERAWGLPTLPAIDDVRALARGWSPHRSHAAALLWASLGPAPGGGAVGRPHP